MAEFEYSVTVIATPDTVFDFVCDVANMPKYLSKVQSAQTCGNDRIRIQRELRGQMLDVGGYFQVDPVEYRLEWGTEGSPLYQGWLEVDDRGDGTSDLTVHLSFASHDTAHADDTIQQGIEDALSAIKTMVEGHGVRIETVTA